ncbi:lipopolysaccharide biosynthesis protein [Arcticibacter tournemirensis]
MYIWAQKLERKASMSTIGKQTIKGSIYSYLGVIIGFFSVTLLRSHGLSTEQNGDLEVIISFSVILTQFGSLGFFSASTRCFPYFRDPEKKHHGFLFLMLIVPFIGTLLICLLFQVLKPLIFAYTDYEDFFNGYSQIILILTAGTLLFSAFDNYNRVALVDAATGSILKEFLQKLTVACALALVLFFPLPFSKFIWIWLIANLIPTIIIIFKVAKQDALDLKPDFKFLTPPIVRMLSSVSLFAVITGLTTMIIQYIDRIMINDMIGTSLTGIYGITAFFGTVVAMPSRIMYRIGGVIIAEKWKSGDLAGISSIYKKSCSNQLLIGLLLFIGIWANIHNILKMIPPEYAEGKYVILFVSLSGLIEMATGMNGVILATSKYYKYDTFFFLGLIVVTIVANYIFIPVWGITGAAAASVLSTLLFNLYRYLFIWKKFEMQPFNWHNLYIVLIGLTVLALIHYMPALPLVPDIIIRSGVITLIYTGVIYMLKIAPEMNETINKLIEKVSRR